MNSGEDKLWKDVFFKDNFTVDEYLATYIQKSDVLTLRKKLKDYGSELYGAMVDILKTETEAIVNLAENLTNLNSKINDLSAPAFQLRETIRELYQAIEDAKQNFAKQLDLIKSINVARDRLNLQIQMMSSSTHINNIIKIHMEEVSEDLNILERAVNEYSLQNLYLIELELGSDKLDNYLDELAMQLTDLVNYTLLEALKKNEEENIIRCLRMYVNLGKQHEAEKLLREKVIHPSLLTIFNQKVLDSNTLNVNHVYQQILTVLNSETILLVKLLKRNPDMRGFSFVLNSFWPEVDKQLRQELPHVTAPGNPELFQRRFKDTANFLDQIARICDDPDVITKKAALQSHLKRFNLPVYFEICFQHIATKFEAEMLLDSVNDDIINSTFKKFHLKVTTALWNGINQCFHDEVYLNHLADQFVKLSVLLLSRYLKWFEDTLAKYNIKVEEPALRKLEEFVVYALVDFNILKELIGPNSTASGTSVYKIVHAKITPLLGEITKLNEQSINSVYTKLQDQLIKFKIQESALHLQQVASIPRLYRRTNRQIPKEPSSYIIEAVTPIVTFHQKFNEIMTEKHSVIVDHIIARLSEQYLTLVLEVLQSVCKTEESLRRLKSRNVGSSSELSAQGTFDATTDEAKIREQIRLDVGYFISKLKPHSRSESQNIFKILIEQSGYVE